MTAIRLVLRFSRRNDSCRNTLAAAMFCGLAVIASGSANAQAAFPAPLPGEAAPSQAPALTPFPPVGGGAAPMRAPAAFPSGGAAPMGGGFGPPPAAAQGGQDCMAEFAPLKQEAEKRGAFIKALGQRHGSPAEACKAIAAFGQAELKMIKFFETNARRCGIPPQVAQQASQGHKMTEQMQTKVCAAAQQPQGGPAPSLTEALGASVSVPEATPTKRSGGSTFDTLSGNVLAR